MLHDRAITIDRLLAWTFWVLGAFAAIGDFVGLLPDDIGFVGLTLVAFANLVAVNRLILCQTERERNAYELGREDGLRAVQLPRR